VAGYEGRLELTWTNKHLRLLAHEDGSYEWLAPSDYRVAEVRLLHDVASVGVTSSRRAVDNLLIRGDALHALTSLTRLPEFARDYVGKVKLAYLDPPFNTQQSFLENSCGKAREPQPHPGHAPPDQRRASSTALSAVRLAV
jgi:adenine-specific DNA-methyltransferase